MIDIMRRRNWFSVLLRSLVLAAVLFAPSVALARTEEEPPEIVDARLEGYAGQMSMPESSTGLTWFVFVILGVVTAAGLFKDAKRSHLD